MKKAEGEETQPGEEGGPAEQEDKVHNNVESNVDGKSIKITS